MNEILKRISELNAELRNEVEKVEKQGYIVVSGYSKTHGDELFIAKVNQKTKSISIKVG
jgi:hypothetical protein